MSTNTRHRTESQAHFEERMKALDTLEESVKAGRLKKGEDDEYTEKTYLTIEILIQLRRISASIRSLAQAFGYSKSEMGRLIFMIAGLGWGYKNEVSMFNSTHFDFSTNGSGASRPEDAARRFLHPTRVHLSGRVFTKGAG